MHNNLKTGDSSD